MEVSGTPIAREIEQLLTKTGFITFAPEWLTGNLNLDSSNFMHLYVEP
jgi:hypothetical protein